MDLNKVGERSRIASGSLLSANTKLKNSAILAVADAIVEHTDKIIAANEIDLKNAKGNITDVMLDRLRLTPERIKSIAAAAQQIAKLADPVFKKLDNFTHENGMLIEKVQVPFGVVAMIYESRPNVTVDAAILCIKSGNCCILRSGKEAVLTCSTIADIMRDAVEGVGLSKDCIIYVDDTSRETAVALMKLNEYIDLLVPRGGAGLIASVIKNATVPVIETGTGNCHIYIHSDADISMAVDIVFNAKTQRPSVCNSAESLVVHKDIAAKVLPAIKKRLDEKDVMLVGDKLVQEILKGTVAATEQDYYTEYLDYKMSVVSVSSLEQAIEHINEHSTKHSDCIVTNNSVAADEFITRIDSAAVYHNVSTRFTDGEEFGLGAEIGISTQKLHARGPMALDGLCTTKFIIRGTGQIRE